MSDCLLYYSKLNFKIIKKGYQNQNRKILCSSVCPAFMANKEKAYKTKVFKERVQKFKMNTAIIPDDLSSQL